MTVNSNPHTHLDLVSNVMYGTCSLMHKNTQVFPAHVKGADLRGTYLVLSQRLNRPHVLWFH